VIAKLNELIGPKKMTGPTGSETSKEQILDLISSVARYGARTAYCRDHLAGQAVPGRQRVFILEPSNATPALSLATVVAESCDKLYYYNSKAGPVLLAFESEGTSEDRIRVLDGTDLRGGSYFTVYGLRRLKGFVDPVYYATTRSAHRQIEEALDVAGEEVVL
jgi:hypothetical protein